VIAKESYRKLRKASTFAIRQAAERLSPSGGTRFKLHSPLSFGECFMKIRSAVPENCCLIVLVDGKKQKKTKKNKKKTAKHIRIRLLREGGCVNKERNGMKPKALRTRNLRQSVVWN